MRTAICLLCVKPNDIWIEFLAQFTHYKIYLMIDDNSTTYTSPHANITYVQIPDQECIDHGYRWINFIFETEKKQVTSWEKALYYFHNKNHAYEAVWYIEEDVFVYKEKTLMDIDSHYPKSDLLASEQGFHEYNKGDTPVWMWWPKIHIKDYEQPYYSSMVCVSRISRALLNKIDEYAKRHKTLFFLEALFPTLCIKNGLKHDMPPQMKNIISMGPLDKKLPAKNTLVHPFKNSRNHKNIRSRLNQTGGRKRRLKGSSRHARRPKPQPRRRSSST
jgi:hypothetical protein